MNSSTHDRNLSKFRSLGIISETCNTLRILLLEFLIKKLLRCCPSQKRISYRGLIASPVRQRDLDFLPGTCQLLSASFLFLLMIPTTVERKSGGFYLFTCFSLSKDVAGCLLPWWQMIEKASRTTAHTLCGKGRCTPSSVAAPCQRHIPNSVGRS